MVIIVQTLPALIIKIMEGSFSPLPLHYSEGLKSIVDLLLELNPSNRPNIHQVYCHPTVLSTYAYLVTDLGMIQCTSRLVSRLFL